MAAISDNDKKIASAILGYLRRVSERENVGEDSKESLEVATMCLQEIFGVQDQYAGTPVLEELITGAIPPDTHAPPTMSHSPPAAINEEAEKLKNEGNAKLKESDYEAAILLYTRAIEISPSNASYYSNRAAAYIKIDDLSKALSDCQQAVSLNPNYARAYGRMGLIYDKMSDTQKAKECFEKALQLDPDNHEFKSSLERLQNPQPNPPPLGFPAGGIPPAGMPDLSAAGGLGGLLSSPAFANLASTVMSNPAFQNMASQMFQQNMGGVPPGATANPEGGASANPLAGMNFAEMMPQLAEMGRQLGHQMRENDPAGFESMREQVGAQFKATHPDQSDKRPPNDGDGKT